MFHIKSTPTSVCVTKMKDVFARFGFPEEIMSDNGLQFASSEFRSFVESNWITHTTSSPFLPNANGEAERAVQTAKRILRQRDPWLTLLIYRDAVISATGQSPTQLLIGRHVKTNLPTPPSAMRSCQSCNMHKIMLNLILTVRIQSMCCCRSESTSAAVSGAWSMATGHRIILRLRWQYHSSTVHARRSPACLRTPSQHIGTPGTSSIVC